MAAILEWQDLRKAFGGIPVLTGVSLALQHGTVTALAGENGAGKCIPTSGTGDTPTCRAGSSR